MLSADLVSNKWIIIISILEKLLIALLIFCTFFLVQRFCNQQTSGFCLEKVQGSIPDTEEWQVDSLFQNADISCLDQPFYFLEKGGQAYVFISQDKKYVIKFLKFRKITPPFFLKMLSRSFLLQKTCLKKILQLRNRIEKECKSYRIACEEFLQESGLVFVRLQKNYPLNKEITVIDKIGIRRQICLNDVVCFVQKKASLIYPGLTQIIQNEGEKGAKAVIDNLINFFINRGEKGILDLDPKINKNLGLIGSEVMQIDLGRLCHDINQKKPKVVHQEIKRIFIPLREWLGTYHPPLASYLDQRLPQDSKET